VDDYDMMCIVPRSLPADEPADDTAALSLARQAYASVGLRPEPKKTSVAQDNADFWGATVQVGSGRVRTHREITVCTMAFVVEILKQKTVAARVWGAVIGLVVYVSFYARPALAFLEVVFHEADGYAPGEVLLSRGGRRGLSSAFGWRSCRSCQSISGRSAICLPIWLMGSGGIGRGEESVSGTRKRQKAGRRSNRIHTRGSL
jgi:hypothetical protein